MNKVEDKEIVRLFDKMKGKNTLEAISKSPLRPNLCVGSRWPILEIPPWRDYCGCPPRSALILNLIVADPGL
jgi:hypothetical protein